MHPDLVCLGSEKENPQFWVRELSEVLQALAMTGNERKKEERKRESTQN